MAAVLNFQIFRKNHKTKNACISKTVPDSVIPAIFFSQGICEDRPFQVSTNISLAKNGGHFEFYGYFSNIQNTKLLVSRKPC